MTKQKKIPDKYATHILRTCKSDMTSHGRFRWPKRGWVEALDWDPAPHCGNGLHGALHGKGYGGLFRWDKDAVWQVVKIDSREVVDLGGKIKVPRGYVIYSGSRDGAIELMGKLGYVEGVIGGTATAGNDGTATAGDYGTATAGDRGTATAGDRGTATAGDAGTATAGNDGTATAGNDGTATAGDYGTATAGDYGTATAGDDGTATAGDYGTATAGDYGTATAGDRGTATAGDYGTATAGNDGTATAGDYGTATAGNDGTATAGDYGILNIRWWDGQRYRAATFYVGENGIEPNTPYRFENGKAVKVQP